MKELNRDSKRIGLTFAILVTVAYAVAIVLIAALMEIYPVFYGLIAVPLLFGLIYSFTYTLKEGLIHFLTPASVMRAYDNPIDNFTRSPFNKIIGSYVLTVVCFIPLLVFYLLFSWIFYLRKAKRDR